MSLPVDAHYDQNFTGLLIDGLGFTMSLLELRNYSLRIRSQVQSKNLFYAVMPVLQYANMDPHGELLVMYRAEFQGRWAQNRSP